MKEIKDGRIKLKLCPFCGWDEIKLYKFADCVMAECSRCGAKTSLRGRKKDAASAWNMRADTVRHGVWTDDGEEKFFCSACGGYVFRWFGKSDFCPRCGAIMGQSSQFRGTRGTNRGTNAEVEQDES